MFTNKNLCLVVLSVFITVYSDNADWRDVEINEVLYVDIEEGIEMKIVYDRTKNPNEIVVLTVSNTHHLTISLGDGRCLFHGCPIGTLDMNTIQNGIPFILKIYRKDGKLLIDLNGNKNVEVDMDTQGYSACSRFWGVEKNYKFQFTGVSSNLQVQLRIEEENEEEDYEDWNEVTINENLDIDIDLGIEMKITFDKTTNPLAKVLLIFNKAEASSSFSLQLYNGQCIFSNCAVKELDMSTVQDGIPFILKIYRRDGQLMIDLDGENKVEVDVNSDPNAYCPSFWGTDDTRTVYFPEKSRDVATHYRMVAENEGDDDKREVDVEGELRKILKDKIDLCA